MASYTDTPRLMTTLTYNQLSSPQQPHYTALYCTELSFFLHLCKLKQPFIELEICVFRPFYFIYNS